ncbi:hypothetical protein L6452_38947 [Arctium lappa]|uniref:Uncharacterized protein n=1 Tax=Arctium lappa TaxID=4217 RepID=A0ACB8XQC8_ARCLA|nr:hypothetical protein L6452_38947 [Arctium lappa]
MMKVRPCPSGTSEEGAALPLSLLHDTLPKKNKMTRSLVDGRSNHLSACDQSIERVVPPHGIWPFYLNPISWEAKRTGARIPESEFQCKPDMKVEFNRRK